MAQNCLFMPITAINEWVTFWGTAQWETCYMKVRTLAELRKLVPYTCISQNES